MLELIIDEQLDLRDLLLIEREALDQDDARLGDVRIGRVEGADEIRLREERRREEHSAKGENQAAGNPSPHNPNLHQPEDDLSRQKNSRRLAANYQVFRQFILTLVISSNSIIAVSREDIRAAAARIAPYVHR
ncbi:MAG TPA: hypothetical protein VJ276_08275, partial [Thermoanaerobaculia bacterium]|nr:hypothetical protein [Thermoanaerobaculia bacterium]